MAEYKKKNFDFILFINEDAVGTKPAVSGSIYINGEEIPLAGWKRTTKSGKPVYSGCKGIKKETKEESKGEWETHIADDEIPF